MRELRTVSLGAGRRDGSRSTRPCCRLARYKSADSGTLRATLPTMGDQIDFDERTAAQLEVVYRTRDIRRRRALAQEALAAQPGDEGLDVGCGPGGSLVGLPGRRRGA